MKISYCTLFLILFTLCGNPPVERIRDKPKICVITSYHHHHHKFMTRSSYWVISKSIGEKNIKFEYIPFPDTSKYHYRGLLIIPRYNDSFILVGDDTCIFLEAKEYRVNGKNFLIKKYFYDNKLASDEEGEYLVNDSLGFVYSNSVVWPRYCTYVYDETTFDLLKLFRKDTSLFIRQIGKFYQYDKKLQRLLKKL